MYPKVTPVYVKLLEICAAVILLVAVLALSVVGTDDGAETLEQHFSRIANQHLGQAVHVSKVLLKQNDKGLLQNFVQSLTESELVEQAHLYDASGEVIAQSKGASSVKTLYGLDAGSRNETERFLPFVQEIRTDELQGYLRLTFEKEQIIGEVKAQMQQQFEYSRVILIAALAVGFLLTRGLSRFSRHGVRPPKKAKGERKNKASTPSR
ncbi:AhpA/YtjB family protein [Thalassotalea maritima]|uniref:AhpA/YtjB family protein n=1 Tax=Thalassotalea maritima TaxID=3242416 RepID=UPI003526EF23